MNWRWFSWIILAILVGYAASINADVSAYMRTVSGHTWIQEQYIRHYIESSFHKVGLTP